MDFFSGAGRSEKGNDRSRKYELDYELRPGSTETRKSESYIYTGDYYSFNLEGTSLTFGKVRLLYLIMSVLQMAAVLGAGLVSSAMNEYMWTALPYCGMVLSAGLAVMGAMELVGCKEEFVRRVNDKGATRFHIAQMVLAASSVVLLVAELVYIILSAAGRNGANLLFLALTLALTLSSAFMVRFTQRHKPVVVRSGEEEFKELQKKFAEESKADFKDEL